MAEAVYSRCVSALKEDRVAASKSSKVRNQKSPRIAPNLSKTSGSPCMPPNRFLHQGYMLMRAAAKEYKWNLNYGGIALMWRAVASFAAGSLAGSRKRSTKSKAHQSASRQVLQREIKRAQRSWRNVVAIAAKKGIAVPAFSTALAFYDAYRSERLPANLLQAQRDYFGATLTNASINRAANSSTLTGLEEGEPRRRGLIMHKIHE